MVGHLVFTGRVTILVRHCVYWPRFNCQILAEDYQQLSYLKTMDTLNKEFIKLTTKSVKIEVKGVTFVEGNYTIMYIPSLNLSSYGQTEEEAKVMMEEHVLPDFCESVVKKPRSFVLQELRKLGWEQNKIFTKKLSRTAYIDKEGILREFDLDAGTVIKEQDLAVVC